VVAQVNMNASPWDRGRSSALNAAGRVRRVSVDARAASREQYFVRALADCRFPACSLVRDGRPNMAHALVDTRSLQVTVRPAPRCMHRSSYRASDRIVLVPARILRRFTTDQWTSYGKLRIAGGPGLPQALNWLERLMLWLECIAMRRR